MHNNLQYSDICTIFRWVNAISSEWRLYDKDITTLKRLLITCSSDQKAMLLESFPSVFKAIEELESA
ncbi:hypothetical protein Elgi_37420 [Paenibacillus elgii]|nr:hypothetical protein Elgi_37420 [Paenibacillus elgii]